MAYALVFLFIFLGMLGICLPRFRKKHVVPPDPQTTAKVK